MVKPGQLAAAKELKKRSNYQAKPIELDPRFTPQNAFITDPSRYIVAQCSRRAGKTSGLAIRFLKTLEKYPKSQCMYLSLTRESALQIMMPALVEMNEKYNIGCTFTKNAMRHPNGSVLHLMGADMKNFIKRVKGRKYPGIAIDEAQDFGSHLQSLIDDVLTPSIADYEDGWLAVTGTPGPVPQGYFFDITQNRKYGFSFHGWTILENPNMPDPLQFIADLKAKREWDDENPTLLREWKNQWKLDVESLWIRYKEHTNHYQSLPPIHVSKWHYILGIDIGYKDADALAVIAYNDEEPITYLVEEVITTKQDITALVKQIEAINKKYNFDKMVMDEGGLGKKIAEEIRRRNHIPVHMADKARKQENVAFLNDSLRLGRFKAKSSSRFAQDSYLIQIDWDKSTPDRIVIKKTPHSDIIDSVLYAFKESPAFTYREPPKKPKYGSKEWAEAQPGLMFDAALEHFQEEAEMFKNINSMGWPDEDL